MEIHNSVRRSIMDSDVVYYLTVSVGSAPLHKYSVDYIRYAEHIKSLRGTIPILLQYRIPCTVYNDGVNKSKQSP